MGRRRWIFAVGIALAATAALPGAAPAATTSTPTLAFGSVHVSESPTLVAIFTREVTDLTFGPPAVDGAGFSIASTTCSTSMPPGDCTVTVTFTPGAAGTASGTLSMPATTPVPPGNSSATVTLSGTGTQPGAALSVPGLAFADRQTGQPPSEPQQFTLSNPGNEALAVSAIAASGDSGDFFVGPTAPGCAAPFSLPPGGACTYAAVFRPTAAGARALTITFAHNAPGGSSSLSLSGTGVAPPPPPTVDRGPGGGSSASGAPLVSIKSPKKNGTVTRTFKARRKGRLVILNRPVTFKGLASDKDGLARVEVALVKGKAKPRFRRAKLEDFAWTYALPTSEKLKPGAYTLLARATDVTGVRSATVSVSFRLR